VDSVQDLSPEDLVAGLHVREVQIVEGVGEKGEAPVDDVVPEVEHAMPARAAQEARAEHDVRPSLGDGGEQRWVVGGVVLEVGVLDHDHVSGGLGEGGPQRRSLAAVRPMLEDPELREARGQGPQALRGAVRGGVVDDEDLLVEGYLADAAEESLHRRFLVVRRDHHRQLHAGPPEREDTTGHLSNP
jgi:hypothetical protein